MFFVHGVENSCWYPFSQAVYAIGGRTFWIHNTGPVGCYPYVLTLYPTNETDKYGCAVPYNEVAQYFNHKLKEVVVGLRKDLPLATITYVDIYTAKYTLITQAEKFGTYCAFTCHQHPLGTFLCSIWKY